MLQIHLVSHFPGSQTVSLQSQGLTFHINLSWVVWKYIFYDAIRNFNQILASVVQKERKHGEGVVLAKNKCHIWTPHKLVFLELDVYFIDDRSKLLSDETQ